MSGQDQPTGKGSTLPGVPFQALVETAIEGIALVTLDGRLRYANPRLAQMFGCRSDELTRRNLLKLLDAPWRQVVRDALTRRRAGLADGYELDVRLADGRLRHLNVRGAPVRDPDGAVSGSVVVIRDDTERRDAENQLIRMALFDPLTGLPNRATLHDRLAHALARRQRDSGTVALLFCDLDEFKQVNDSLGHVAGDELLRIVAGRLARAIRPADTIGRFGGDEFLVLCEDLPYPAEAVHIAERLQAALRPRLTVAGTDLTVTASIGIAYAPETHVEADQLLENADLAMYRAKAHGRARYDVYGVEPVNTTAEWLRLLAELRRGLRERELVVHYQPRVDVRTLHIVGAEALLRWQHPTRGLLSPDAFLDTAERSGLIGEIDEQVMRTACADAATWPADARGFPMLVSVNVAARHLTDNGIVIAVNRALADTGLDPRRLVLELTESAVMEDVEAALRVFG